MTCFSSFARIAAGLSSMLGLIAASAGGSAQTTEALCADPGGSCAALVSQACLDQVERFGAGSLPAGQRSAACDLQMASYGQCLQRVALECGGAPGVQAEASGCDDALAIKLWQDVKDTDNPAELEGLALACPNTAAARLAKIRAEGLRARPASPAALVAPTRRAGDVFSDCPTCPDMVAIPAGSFVMGSPEGEADRSSDESPQRTVRVAAFALGRTEVTRGAYARFVAETGHAGGLGPRDVCRTLEAGAWATVAGRNWRDAGIPQSDTHPAICVSWEDAQSYIAWLNTKVAGAPYRLPSAAEWEYAARAGGETPYVWGADPNAGCGSANIYDATAAARHGFRWEAAACDDGFAFTAPVGSFAANPFKLADMIGNVWEWTEDCWHESYAGAPSDGIAWMSGQSGDCSRGGLRGGAWDFKPTSLRTANRNRTERAFRGAFVGFRVARTLAR